MGVDAHAILIELNEKYASMARARLERDAPLLANVEVRAG